MSGTHRPAGGGVVADPAQLAAGLSPAMRRALGRRQEDLVEDRAVVTGAGITMKALRARGIVEGAMPHARVTNLGRKVIAADPVLGSGPA